MIKNSIMRKTIIMTIAAFAMASAAFAQTEATDAKAQAKAEKALAAKAAKELKAKNAAELKAFKDKQKLELAAFVEAQKNGAKNNGMVVENIAIESEADSLAYIFGVCRSDGLKQYATTQLGVSEEMLGKFAEGILARAEMDPNDKELAAYNTGSQIGSQIVQMAQQFSKDYYAAEPDKSINTKIVAAGILAGLFEQSEMSLAEANEIFQTKMTARQAANNEILYGANREAGIKFLEENKTKEGVIVLPSGLQYKVITMGNGEKPKASDKVEVDYEGTLIDGTVFDSSYKRGKSTTFGVTQVIKGWTEALQLMPVGSKWELYIPYELAYGEREAGKEIKPYSALIFTIELKNIVK